MNIRLKANHNKDNRLLCKKHRMFRPGLKKITKLIFQLVSFFRLGVLNESEQKKRAYPFSTVM